MELNILGTTYTVDVVKRDQDQHLEDSDGYCDDSVKKIVLAFLEAKKEDKQDLMVVRQKVRRHEILHAFLCESGLAENSDWAQNEEMVDWFAIQGPKIFKAWQEAGAL